MVSCHAACSKGLFVQLSSFSTSNPHVLKISGLAKTRAVFLQKKQFLPFSSRSSSCCSPPREAAPAVLPHPASPSVCSFPRSLHPKLFPEGIPAGFRALRGVWSRRAASSSSAVRREPRRDRCGSPTADHRCQDHPDGCTAAAGTARAAGGGGWEQGQHPACLPRGVPASLAWKGCFGFSYLLPKRRGFHSAGIVVILGRVRNT